MATVGGESGQQEDPIVVEAIISENDTSDRGQLVFGSHIHSLRTPPDEREDREVLEPTINNTSDQNVLEEDNLIQSLQGLLINDTSQQNLQTGESAEASRRGQNPVRTEEMSGPLPECPVCACSPVHPVKLSCNHIFCFMCIKGWVARDPRCAMCREPIPAEYVEDPLLVKVTQEKSVTEENPEHDEWVWFYEGRSGGWWRFEERISADIEKAFTKNPKPESILVFIAGFQYTIDFSTMKQYRQQYPNRTRGIKREKLSNMSEEEIRGVSGIRKC